MYYLEHNKRYCEFTQAQRDLQEVLNEKDTIQARTEPKISYEERVSGSPRNQTEEYVIEMERRNLRKRIDDAQAIVDARRYLLNIAEEQLRKSKDLYDLIYTMRWVDGHKVRYIQRKLDFMGIECSRSHMYEIIKRIRQQIRRDF